MINDYFGPFPNTTAAFHKDGSNNEYYGRAAKGAKESNARWQIVKLEKTGTTDWITKYPDGTDAPKFIWDDVESLTYKLLGT